MPIIRTVDHKGRVYDRFHARRDILSTGWVVFGRNPEYGDCLVMCCAWRRDRSVKPWKGKRMGFKTYREAAALAAEMNGAVQ